MYGLSGLHQVVVNIVGNASNYVATLNTAVSSTQRAVSAISSSITGSLSSAFSSMSASARSAFSTLANYFIGGTASVSGLGAAFSAMGATLSNVSGGIGRAFGAIGRGISGATGAVSSFGSGTKLAFSSFLNYIIGGTASIPGLGRAMSAVTSAATSLGGALAPVGRMLGSVGSGIASAIPGLLSMSAAVIGATTAIVGLNTALGILQNAIQGAAKQEMTEIAFTSLVGNAEKAKTAISEIQQFAIETPFRMPELMDASKRMIAFGEEAENIVPTMRMLGDVASGLEIPLGQLVYLYGTLKAQGRAFTIDIRQFAMRGIPIYEALAKSMGLVDAQAKKLPTSVRNQLNEMIKTGKVNFSDVEKAFKQMTAEGGRFGGLMEKTSKSIMGLASTLLDAFDITSAKVMRDLFEHLNVKDIMKEIIDAGNALFAAWMSIPREVKITLATIIAAAAAVAALVTLVLTAVAAFATLTTGISAIFAVGGMAAMITQLGGISAAWTKVKETALGAWAWLKPTRQAITEFASYLWRAFQRAILSIWNGFQWLIGMVSGLFGSGIGDLQDDFTHMLLVMEYGMLSLERDVILLWQSIGAGIGVIVAVIVGALYLLAKILIFIVKTIGNLFELISLLPLEKIGINLPKFEAPELSKELENLPATFEEFKRLREEARANAPTVADLTPAAKGMAEKGEALGDELGANVKKGAMKHKIDPKAFLVGSMEDVQRWAAQLASFGVQQRDIYGNPINLNVPADDSKASITASNRELANSVQKNTEAIHDLPEEIAAAIIRGQGGVASSIRDGATIVAPAAREAVVIAPNVMRDSSFSEGYLARSREELVVRNAGNRGISPTSLRPNADTVALLERLVEIAEEERRRGPAVEIREADLRG